MHIRSLSVLQILAVLWILSMASLAFGQARGLPPEFERLLSRGEIAAIDDPVFVAAGEAQIAGQTWVLGVVVNGQAKAYSLNLLSDHEVVNDVFGDKPVSAVW